MTFAKRKTVNRDANEENRRKTLKCLLDVEKASLLHILKYFYIFGNILKFFLHFYAKFCQKLPVFPHTSIKLSSLSGPIYKEIILIKLWFKNM